MREDPFGPGLAVDSEESDEASSESLPPSHQEVAQLLARGEMVVALVQLWTESVVAMLDRFEAALAPLALGDEAHQEVGHAAGVEAIFGVLEALAVSIEDVR